MQAMNVDPDVVLLQLNGRAGLNVQQACFLLVKQWKSSSPISAMQQSSSMIGKTFHPGNPGTNGYAWWILSRAHNKCRT